MNNIAFSALKLVFQDEMTKAQGAMGASFACFNASLACIEWQGAKFTKSFCCRTMKTRMVRI